MGLCRKMEHRVGLMRAEDTIERLSVADISLLN